MDAFDGLGDLERGQIRCVGDPDTRFAEDALRMLRAVLWFADGRATRLFPDGFCIGVCRMSMQRSM